MLSPNLRSVEYGGTNTKFAEFYGSGSHIWHPEVRMAQELKVKSFPSPIITSGLGSLLLPAIEEGLKRHLGISISQGIPLSAISVCGPVTRLYNGSTCIDAMVNTNMKEQCIIEANPSLHVGNDAVFALVGSYTAGALQGHKGGASMITLGTGVGRTSRVKDPLSRRFSTIPHEVHGTVVPDFTQECGCGLRGCIESATSQQGLFDLARKYNIRLVDSVSPRNIGYTLKAIDASGDQPDALHAMFDEWYYRLAYLVNDSLCLDLGRNESLPPPKIVFAGGLASLVDPRNVKRKVLELRREKPFYGDHFDIAIETLGVNVAPLIGGAAVAQAVRAYTDPFDITWSEGEPDHP